MKYSLACWLVVALVVSAPAVRAGTAGDGPAVGAGAPAFSLPGSDGRTHTLEEYRGRTVVLAWFPKAFTGG